MPTKYYFDNAATTPVREEVLQEILPYFREYYGNASSIYSIAKESKSPYYRLPPGPLLG